MTTDDRTTVSLALLDGHRNHSPASAKSQARSLEAFTTYAALGPSRSLERLRKELGDSAPSRYTLEMWSSRDHWQDRVASFDRDVAARALAQQAEDGAQERVCRRRERLELADKLKAVIRHFLADESGQPRRRARPGTPNGITARELEVASAALARVADLEVRDMGEATERVEAGVIIRAYSGFDVNDV